MGELDPDEDFVREFAAAEARGRGGNEPRAVGARLLSRRKVLVVTLAGGVELHVPLASLEGLATASRDDLCGIEITPGGTGLHFPRIDADIHVPSLVAGLTGSRRWTATQRERWEGATRPGSGAEAARAIGRGGRSRKAGGA